MKNYQRIVELPSSERLRGKFYLEKRLNILNTNEFTKLITDPTKIKKEGLQRVLLRILKEVFQQWSIQPYIPQGYVREKFMIEPNFIR